MSAYPQDDPRARAFPGAHDGAQARPAGVASQVNFTAILPHEAAAEGSTWLARGENFVVAYSQVTSGWEGVRSEQLDEYLVLLPDRTTHAELEAGGESVDIDGYSVVIVPPGPSRLSIQGEGQVVRVMSSRAADLLASAANADVYKNRPAAVAPFVPWPESPDGNRIRAYGLDIQPDAGRFGRIFRCSTLMINVLDDGDGPRDVTRMSPHYHADFEQGSLVLEGDYVHHIRWPWTPNMEDWRPDEHLSCGAPSLMVIPPPALHTSQAVGTATNRLVDIFCPPREDFSAQAGWVLNHDDYPLLRSS